MRGFPAARALPAVVIVAVLGLLVPAPASSVQRGTVLHPGTGLSTNYDFARLVLADGGWPQSSNNVTAMIQWLRAEEPPEHWWNRNNPLNNGLGSGGGQGLGSYRSLASAAYFAAHNLVRTAYGYPLVAHDLDISAPPSETARAIWRSHWAGGHYGFGAGWATTPVPSVDAPPSAWRDPAACPIRYPAHVLGPCGAGFEVSGPAWRPGAPSGYRSDELWVLAGTSARGSSARWSPALAAGTYEVAAFIPARFADATVAYVVVDGRGAHRVEVDQEPFRDSWVTLGTFRATRSSSVRVVMVPPVHVAFASSYAAADAMRFRPVRPVPASAASVAPHHAPRAPSPPEAVAAVAGVAAATVSWLAPSKDGGATVSRYEVTTSPGGHHCRARLGTTGRWSCLVGGLKNGTSYTFVVRAVNRAGTGTASTPTSPVRPLAGTVLRLVAPPVVPFGERLVVRALLGDDVKGGSVLFFEDGRSIKSCRIAKVRKGQATCAVRLGRSARHVVLATFSGDATHSGTGRRLAVIVQRARTRFDASVLPLEVGPGEVAAFRAFHLPGHATGKVVFSAGTTRLCVARVRDGGGSCAVGVRLASGAHLVVARYLGDANYGTSNARTWLQVTRAR